MMTFTSGLVLAATITTTSGYARLGFAMMLLGAGLGLASAPATESIMGSLPRNRAGVGSAVNDTAREVGGALGVAVAGSVMSSIYRTQLTDALPKNLPTQVATSAHDSLGAALQVSSRLGEGGAELASVARDAFVHAMSQTSLVVAAVAVIGAVIAWRFLPARAADELETGDKLREPSNASLPWYIQACACSYGYGRTCECVAQCRDELEAQCECPPDEIPYASTAIDGSYAAVTT